MALLKCKMCGGTIEFEQGATVGVCDSCGTKQTLPRLDDDRRANLYDRANHFRRNNEFDKAAAIYEQILNEDTADAEAYWSLVLCQYGIEYVEDPATLRRVPTVNRAQFTSIFDDENYKSALQYADGYQRELYEQEAKAINDIQKGILAISQKEEPFDVFICYKETDSNGRRTPDSVLANDLYHQLVNEGFKVFFSRITLEDKLGTAYEPYIFAALNSAKVMVVLGTKPEYFNAVWVKNEWSRFLALVKTSGGKKILIPAYKDMDPYDLPEEFSHLQAQDMSKLGFMQDLIRGIKKLAAPEEPKTIVREYAQNAETTDIVALLKRAKLFLSDGNWTSANEYCEKVLDNDPENSEAYLYKLMAELHIKKEDDIGSFSGTLKRNGNYKKIMLFCDEALKARMEEYDRSCRYNYAVEVLKQKNYVTAKKLFETMVGYKDAEHRMAECEEGIQQQKKDFEQQKKDFLQVAEKTKIDNQKTEDNIAKTKKIRKLTFISGSVLAIIVFISAFPLYNLYYHYHRVLNYGDVGYGRFYLFGPLTKEIIIGVSIGILIVSFICFLVLGNIIKKKKSQIVQVSDNFTGLSAVDTENMKSTVFPAVSTYAFNSQQKKEKSQEEPNLRNNDSIRNKTKIVVHYTGPFSVAPVVQIHYNNILIGTISKNETKEYFVDQVANSSILFTANRRTTKVLLIGDTSIELNWNSLSGTLNAQTSALFASNIAYGNYTIRLLNTGTNKIAVINIIRNITGLGLAEAKQITDSVPSIITTAKSIEAAEKIKNSLEAVGAAVEIIEETQE